MTSIPFAAKWATYKRSLRNSLSNGKFAGPNGTPNDYEKKPGVSTATLGRASMFPVVSSSTV